MQQGSGRGDAQWEAGIGKSWLVRALIEQLAETPFTRLEYRCSPYHQHTALYPAVDLLQRSLRFDSTTSTDEKMTRLETLLHEHQLDLQEHLPLLASLRLAVPASRALPAAADEPAAAAPTHAGHAPGAHTGAVPGSSRCSSLSRICTGSIRPPWSGLGS